LGAGEGTPRSSADLASRRAMISIDELFRGYPERLAMHTITYSERTYYSAADVGLSAEMFRAAAYWARPSSSPCRVRCLSMAVD
jgi:hypothetical protein